MSETYSPRATFSDGRAEATRLEADERRTANWTRWGPYLSERQWGTVREDYSESGESWTYFPHDHARSRTYRWGEDGLLGICDRECRLAFAVALWNERDAILKERLFGLTGPEGNHGEDVKECYYYLDATPTSSYLKVLYKYPQRAFPYAELVAENQRRGHAAPEFELTDTGVFDDDRYFDVVAEYAKAGPDDICIRLTIHNRGPDDARLHMLPTLWFRNTWSWGRTGERFPPKPRLEAASPRRVVAEHATLGRFVLTADDASDGTAPELLFTENESNTETLFGAPSAQPFVKDAFHEYVVRGRRDAVNSRRVGTKAAARYVLAIPARGSVVVRLRLCDASRASADLGHDVDEVIAQRVVEADAFYASRIRTALTEDEFRVMRQAYAGLLWSKQFYHYSTAEWLDGDPAHPPPPAERKAGRNADWRHFYAADVLSMPDKWEYPWFAAWDLAFHMIPMAKVDPSFAKQQLALLLREWYMHPNGQIPAYEFNFGDVNPPVHAWAAWRVYKMTGARGKRDRLFLARVFQKLLINFTWWVNRKDPEGHNLFSGGFLGLDNIGVFDRSKPLPTGGRLEQADGTAWMAFYCNTMLAIALELASEDPSYEDVASKFFEHFVAIADAMNTLGGSGLWDEEDGFYYDQLYVNGAHVPLRVRSMVGLAPLFACEIIDDRVVDKLPGFKKRMEWFLRNRPDLARHISYMSASGDGSTGAPAQRLLAVPSRERLERVVRYLVDETEFLSPFGIRSVSRVHEDRPYVFYHNGDEYRVAYDPGEGTSGAFGGNSNWRGPIWFPMNYLLIEALERYDHFYGDSFQVECPKGSGQLLTLGGLAGELSTRLTRLFLRDGDGRRPCHGDDRRYADDPHWRDLVLFHEYFHGDTGRGAGASHQTGWTALVVRCLENLVSPYAITMEYRLPELEIDGANSVRARTP